MAPPAKTTRYTWPRLKKLALSLNLPNVVEAVSWGQPNLKAHGKMWAWWSPHEDAAVFKVSKETREILLDALPERFFVTPHYAGHAIILMRPENFDEDWARDNLLETWRAMAPKKLLKEFDAESL